MDAEKKYPTWLEGHIKDWAEKRLATMTLCSRTGAELLEVWYYGRLLRVEGEAQPFIADTEEAPGMVFARDAISGEEFLIFDGAKHGYDAMFCDEYDAEALASRALKRYDIPPSKLILELGYSIDYEDEKETFDIDEKGNVELIDGRTVPWETVKRDGFDYISLSFIDKDGKQRQFLDAELA